MSNEWYDSLPNPDDAFFPPSQDSGPVNTKKLEERLARLEELIRALLDNMGEEGRRSADSLGVLEEGYARDTFRNLITNGDFTNWPSGSGAAPGWTKVASPTILLNTDVPTDSLGNSADIFTLGSGAGLLQAVTVSPGKAYTLDFKWKAVLNNALPNLIITSDGTPAISSTIPLTVHTSDMVGEWDQTPLNPEQLTYEMPSGATTLTIRFVSSSAVLHNWRITDVALWEGSSSHPYSKKVLDETTGLDYNSILLGREKDYASHIWVDKNDILAARVFGA